MAIEIGKDSQLHIPLNSVNGFHWRNYLGFDVSELPADTTVSKAVLSFEGNGVGSTRNDYQNFATQQALYMDGG